MKLLIVSDIHGNWAALQSVLDAGADSDKILCLGDPVDYGPDPAACVTWELIPTVYLFKVVNRQSAPGLLTYCTRNSAHVCRRKGSTATTRFSKEMLA